VTLPVELTLATETWQQQLRNVVSSRAELLALLGLENSEVGDAGGACEEFALKVPRSFVRRMRSGDPRDPLLLQVLSSAQEMQLTSGYSQDPVGENGPTLPERGIIHKYQGRVLLIVSGACAVNCRYCFRRHFPYNDHQNSREQWSEALQFIRDDDSIEEVILSGGDPLVAPDALLQQLLARIADIDHVRRLRIHTRLPVVIPERVTPELLDAVTHPGLQTVVVIHCNHAREIDESVRAAMTRFRDAGIMIFNQAVLLAGINDSVEAQLTLSRQLFAAGVLPYYLHVLDKVQGAAHFDVTEDRAQHIIGELAAALPGYMVPKLVRDIAGANAKVPVPPLS
jgi:EF-P beta-lysylation protein EpmB